MNTRLVIDEAGRVIIPLAVREELHLEAGDELELESADAAITLRPLRASKPLAKEHGIWVFRIGEPLSASTTNDVLQQVREERDQSDVGPRDEGIL